MPGCGGVPHSSRAPCQAPGQHRRCSSSDLPQSSDNTGHPSTPRWPRLQLHCWHQSCSPGKCWVSRLQPQHTGSHRCTSAWRIGMRRRQAWPNWSPNPRWRWPAYSHWHPSSRWLSPSSCCPVHEPPKHQADQAYQASQASRSWHTSAWWWSWNWGNHWWILVASWVRWLHGFPIISFQVNAWGNGQLPSRYD